MFWVKSVRTNHTKMQTCQTLHSYRDGFTWTQSTVSVNHKILFAFLERRRRREATGGRVGELPQRKRRRGRAAEPAVRTDGLFVGMMGSVGALGYAGLTRYHQFRHRHASGELLHGFLGVVVVYITHARAGCWGIGRFCHHAFEL